MNSLKVLLAALLLGAFSLTVTGCPGKKEEAPAVVTEEPAAVEDTGAASEETMDEATDEMPEDAE